MKTDLKLIFLLAVLPAFLGTNAMGQSILFTKHNLSMSGPGPIKAVVEDRICIFCHASSRQSGMAMTFLWNRKDTTRVYTPYRSSTLHAKVGQPTGASRICLSCHDGTIALGALASEPEEIPFRGGLRVMPAGPARLGTDLSDDHPVSFAYDSQLAYENGELTHPSMLPPQIKLDKDGRLQCTACHDPHDNTFGKFLVMPNDYSNLCITCHEKAGWSAGSHSLSFARWDGVGTDPWPNTAYETVAENGCESCHRPHNAGGHERLLRYPFEEDNCLVCHNGNVASKDIERELTKHYGHFVQDYTRVHNTIEDFSLGNVPRHVECEDCHNPHQTNSSISQGPTLVSGANEGVIGIDIAGRFVPEARYLYQICFKCHADNNVLKVFPITRQIDQLNTRLEFDPGNPSFHPTEAIGTNPDVPSLLSPLTPNSLISCTDCHSSDNPAGPKGPHGSVYPFLLEKNYDPDDYTTETSFAYDLCYKCHSRISILSDESFGSHKKHIVDEKASCALCHDPHGISDTQGNITNNSHLMNFKLPDVRPNSAGIMRFEDLGTFRGSCSLTCHGEDHNPKVYGG